MAMGNLIQRDYNTKRGTPHRSLIMTCQELRSVFKLTLCTGEGSPQASPHPKESTCGLPHPAAAAQDRAETTHKPSHRLPASSPSWRPLNRRIFSSKSRHSKEQGSICTHGLGGSSLQDREGRSA